MLVSLPSWSGKRAVNTVPEPWFIGQTAHIWGGFFYLSLPRPEIPFYRCVQFVINLPINTKHRRKSQGRGSFCFEHTRNNGLGNSWESMVASREPGAGSREQGAGSGEQGAGNGDSCSTGTVEAPGLCPQFALAGARPWETGASSLTQKCAEGSPL